MERKILGLVVLAMLLGCAKDPVWPPQEVLKITVRPVWNGAPFDKTIVYPNGTGQRVLVQQVKFYLSGLRLKKGNAATLLSDAELLDITNGERTRVYAVPAGEYDSLRFGLGLPPSLNHQDISDIDPASPLGNNSGMYWTWATMYRFLLFDGRFDNNVNGTGTPPYQFSIHTGRDTCYRERALHVPLTVVQHDTTRITLTVDIARFFSDGQRTIDLSQGNQSHGEPSGLPLAMTLSDLAIEAVSTE